MQNILDFLQSASNEAAGTVSAPVDGIAWLLRKAGIPVPEDALGSSEWMARKGLTREVPQNAASLAGATAGLLSPMAAAAKAPQIARGLLQAGDNLAAPRTIVGPSAKERGVIGPFKRNDLGASEYQDLISSQRFLDRDIVADKIKRRDFRVAVTPPFEVEGQMVRAIQDGHHALEAAVRSGHRPDFIEQTPTMNDRISLINKGQIDDFLLSAYQDAPWYRWASKADIW